MPSRRDFLRGALHAAISLPVLGRSVRETGKRLPTVHIDGKKVRHVKDVTPPQHVPCRCEHVADVRWNQKWLNHVSHIEFKAERPVITYTREDWKYHKYMSGAIDMRLFIETTDPSIWVGEAGDFEVHVNHEVLSGKAICTNSEAWLDNDLIYRQELVVNGELHSRHV